MGEYLNDFQMPPLLRFLLSALALIGGLVSAAPVVTFSTDGYDYGENSAPTTDRVTLVRDTADGDSAVTVTFPGTGTAASGMDYTAIDIPVIFSGSELVKTIEIPITQDNIVELDETFELTLQPVANATIGIRNTATVTILNDDQSVIGLACADVIEGDSGTPEMVFTVTMDKEVDVPVTVALSAGTGGATIGVDFRPRSDRVTVTTAGTPFEVDIIPDNLAENKEYIMCTMQKRFLEASGRNVIFRNNVNGFIFMYGILNDDFAPVANDDGLFEVIEDGSLTVSAAVGLLVNDTDQDDDDGPAHLTAVLKSGPARGTLAINPDGGFTYNPAPDFYGADSFTYTASDGTNESPAKTARINVIEQIDIAVGVDLLQSPLVVGGGALDVFRVTVINRGPSNATELRLRQNERFPEFIAVTSAAASAGTYDRGLWSLDLAANATATLTLTIQAGPDAPSGTGVLPFGFSFGAARQAEINLSNNTAAVSASIISAADTGTAITVAPAVDLQSGLFVGKVTVTNQNSEPIPAFRLYVKNLPEDVRVYNAHGTRSFGPHLAVLPYLLHNRPLAAGDAITLSVEFFRPSLDPDFTPEYEIELLPVPETEPASATTGIPVTRNQRLSNGDHLIEIASIPGAVYAVEYSHDMTAWTRVMPSVTAPANRLQWIDNGPPKTANHPATVPSRYYRFVLISSPMPTPIAP